MAATSDTTKNHAATEAAAVAALAQEATKPHPVEDGALYVLADGRQIDTERRLPHPRRAAGTATLYTGAAFSAYVNRFQSVDAVLYADRERFTVVAVLNDSSAEHAGWGDFRAELRVRNTKAWQHWASQDGIVAPEPAAMLEVAQSFEVHRTVSFRSGSRLASGERQLVYVESDESAGTSARGKQGTIEFPEQIMLRLEPFEGSAPYGIEARVRYRISPEGQLAMGYTLDRPHELLERAFDEFVDAIKKATSVTTLIGSPASPR